MAGRKRKPTQLKKLAGNPGKRKLPKDEPKLKTAIPTCPAHFEEECRELWDKFGVLLYEMGVITHADSTALEMLITTYREWREADSVIQSRGLSYPTVTQAGSTVYRAVPEVAMRSDAARRLQSLLSEFGLSPASRSKVSAAGDSGADPMEDFLSEGLKVVR